MDQLATLNQEIQQIVTRVHLLLKRCQSSDTINTLRDMRWGQRIVTLTIQLDEFSAERIEHELPELRRLLTEFHTLRRTERLALDEVEKTRMIRDINLATRKPI